jgi:ADP-ribose pyrophosphatase
VHRPSAVVVAPLRRREDGKVKVLLVSQERPAVGEEDLVELVAGKIDPGEDPLTTAKRETQEEAGLQGDHWHLLSDALVPASGYCDELIYIYAAFGLTTGSGREEDAHIKGKWVLLDEALRMVRDNEIREIKARDALRTVAERHRDWTIA